MKTKLLVTLTVVFASILVCNAQKVELSGTEYRVKEDKIYLCGNDVTEALSEEQRGSILTKIEEQKQAEKEQKEAAIKAKQEAREQRKVQRQEKRKAKYAKNVNNAKKKLAHKEARYTKLKEKGELSPNDEKDWLKKIDRYKERVAYAESKLQ